MAESSSSLEELLPRPLTRLRTRAPSPPPPLLRSIAPLESPPQEHDSRGNAGSYPSREPRLGFFQRNREDFPPPPSSSANRRVSWGDHRRDFFPCGEVAEGDQGSSPLGQEKVCCCPPSPSPSPKNPGGGDEDREEDGGKAADESEIGLANLFRRDGSDDGGGDGSHLACSGSGGGWKADFSSDFKTGGGLSISAAAVPQLARIAAASPSNSSSFTTSSLLPRPVSTSPTKTSTKLVPCAAAAASPKKKIEEPSMPDPPNIRSATPTPRSPPANPRRDQSSPTKGKSVTTDDRSSDVVSENRFINCNQKDRSHLALQIGVERELQVEGPRKITSSRPLTGPPKKKPPMRFGLPPAKSEILNKAAGMNAELKARFTVLPVVTLSKSSKHYPRPRRERPFSSSRLNPEYRSSRLNPEYRGGWSRQCSAVLPRPHSCQSHHSHGHSHSHSRASVPSPAELDLATPSVNSTAMLLEKLEETRWEKFDPRAALEECHDVRLPRRREQSQCSDADLAERYKDLCKITEDPPSSRPRSLRKQRTDLMAALRRNKPQISDLWIPSEQCPQVCSTAPIRIEQTQWRDADNSQKASAEESAREALFRGSREAMSLYNLPTLF